MIKSQTTRRFRQGFANLPREIKQQAMRAYRPFQTDPHHPGLQFKKVESHEGIYSVRIGRGYRALGVLKGNRVVWFWIGGHTDYDRLI